MLALIPKSAADIQAALPGRRLSPDVRVTTQHGVPCTPVHASYGRHVDEAEVLAGRATWLEVTLTGDGRGYHQGAWHTGPEAESVWVERWGPGGCEFHGWIDSVSRRLVQAG